MKNLILDGVAHTLNIFGKAMVFSYDVAASGVGKMRDVAKKTPHALGKVRDVAKETTGAMKKLGEVTKKASDATRKVLGLPQQDTPAREAMNQKTVKKRAKKRPQESVVTKEATNEEGKGEFSTENKKLLNAENLEKMVKPQLLSLCKDLNIECNYTDTKDQIIAKILESK